MRIALKRLSELSGSGLRDASQRGGRAFSIRQPAKKLGLVVCGFMALCTTVSVAEAQTDGGLLPAAPFRNAKHTNPTDMAARARGEGGTPLGNGEFVSVFNGNLEIRHSSSGTLLGDGGMSFSLLRVYNSHSVFNDRVPNDTDFNETLRGGGWVGLGWTSHLGRLVSMPTQIHTASGYDHRYTYYESPTGSWSREKPYKDKSRPDDIKWKPRCDAGYQTPSCCSSSKCIDSPICEPPDPTECGTRPPTSPPEFYKVDNPDGSVSEFAFQVAEESTADGWLKNWDRAGWYLTKLRDVFGNELNVSYWGSGHRFPEAIRRIWSSASTTEGAMDISTELCTSADPVGQCPVAALDLLKKVKTSGVPKPDGTSQTIVYEFFYDQVSAKDDYYGTGSPKKRDFARLKEVRSYGVDANSQGAPATSVASVKYSYGDGTVQPSSNTFNYTGFITRVDYPLGAVSEFSYNEQRIGSSLDSQGSINNRPPTLGVTTRTLFPDGKTPQNGIANQMKWTWWRDFVGQASCNQSPQTFYSTAPGDRDWTTYNFFGHACGYGGIGVPGTIKWLRRQYTYEEAPNRQTDFTFDTDTWNHDGDSEQIDALTSSVTETFLDDKGQCFGNNGDGVTARAQRTSFTTRVRSANDNKDLALWKRTTVEAADASGDPAPGYFKTGQRFEVQSDYETSGPRVDAHIYGAYSYQRQAFNGSAAETELSWDSQGRVTTTRAKQTWGAGVGLSVPPSAGDVVTHLEYGDSKGALTRSWMEPGASYGDGSLANSYDQRFEVDRSVPVRSWWIGGTYNIVDLTLSSSGAPKEVRDENQVLTRLEYDALGRPTAMRPPDSEYPIRFSYPSLNESHSVLGPSSSSLNRDSSDPEQIYSDSKVDGLGRIIERGRLLPDGSRAVQVMKYDEGGRLAFVSEWLPEGEVPGSDPITWQDVSVNGVHSYQITGVPAFGSAGARKPRGTTFFYHTGTAGNPLLGQAEVLGRLVRIEFGGDPVAEFSYCGIHRQIKTWKNNPPEEVVTTYFYDGLGHLVLVDSPGGEADAEYDYDANGRLNKSTLRSSSTPRTYETWRTGLGIPPGADGQERRFSYDAIGRLKSRQIPEENMETVQYQSYDNLGNLLEWTDIQGSRRGYFFRNTFDPMGRLQKSEKIRGAPQSPSTADLQRITQAQGGLESTSGWEFGILDGANFVPNRAPSGGDPGVQSYWKVATYGNPPCIIAPSEPAGSPANGHGLYIGNNCNYQDAPSGPQVARIDLGSLSHDDVVNFKYWRQLREGTTGKDVLTVYVARKQAATNDLSDKRILLRLDSSQRSFSEWVDSLDLRPGDLFCSAGPSCTSTSWPEAAGTAGEMPLWLVFVFEKGDTAQTGALSGLMIDDIFVGRRGKETLASFDYDQPHCQNQSVQGNICDNQFSGDLAKGHLTTARSFDSNRLVSERRFVYKGLNGRLSAFQDFLDWTGAAVPLSENSASWLVVQGRYSYSPNGGVSSISNPTPLGQEWRTYDYSMRRGALWGIAQHDGQVFLDPNRSGGSAVEYSAFGGLSKLRFANSTSQEYAYDPLDRISSIGSYGPVVGGSGSTDRWLSGNYGFDRTGNIVSIGGQYFRYDNAGRLIHSETLPQASDKNVATPEALTYSYDAFGNPLTGSRDSGTANPPMGLPFNYSYGTTDDQNRNRVLDSPFAYGPNGTAQRWPSQVSGSTAAAAWDDLNRMRAYFEGAPESGGKPDELYRYDSQGMRFIRTPIGRDGVPVITIRDLGGDPLAEFLRVPGTQGLTLNRDYVNALGRLLVERVVVAAPPTETTQAQNNAGGNFNLNSTAGSGDYACEVETASGWHNSIPTLTASSNGNFSISESQLLANQTNFVTIRKQGAAPSDRSAPISLTFDTTVNSSSTNQVRAMSVERIGSTVTLKWALNQSNGKTFRVYFKRSDTNTTLLLTPQALSSGTSSFTLYSQALGSPCGWFTIRQLQGTVETGDSRSLDLPPASSLNINWSSPCAGGGGGGSGSSSYSFDDLYRHSDHLGSARWISGEDGFTRGAHDFLPFGQEVLLAGHSISQESKFKFAGYERNDVTANDEMAFRSKAIGRPSFLTLDPAGDASWAQPTSWNMFTYARGNPLRWVDPTGLLAIKVTKAECWAVGGWYFAGTGACTQVLPDGTKVAFASEVVNVYGVGGHIGPAIAPSDPGLRGTVANGGEKDPCDSFMNELTDAILPDAGRAFSASGALGGKLGLTIGTNPDGSPYLTVRFGAGLGYNYGMNSNTSSPGYTNDDFAAIGLFAEAGLRVGPARTGFQASMGISSPTYILPTHTNIYQEPPEFYPKSPGDLTVDAETVEQKLSGEASAGIEVSTRGKPNPCRAGKD